MTLEHLNQLPESEAKHAFLQCCTATQWIDRMVAGRPYSSLKQLHTHALTQWQSLSEPDWLEAFQGHPKIGDINSLKQKYAHSKSLAAGEQHSVESADEDTLQALMKGNELYERQNGFIFIVCATGKSAPEMLNLLNTRLQNSREQELHIAAEQQSQITATRINKLFQEP